MDKHDDEDGDDVDDDDEDMLVVAVTVVGSLTARMVNGVVVATEDVTCGVDVDEDIDSGADKHWR